jgi:hypothetical protein
MAADLPRGVRLNNPGNIEHGDPWQGLAPDQPDATFCNFLTPPWGFRAMAQTLATYQDRYKLNTIAGIIARWAPPEDHNDTPAYIAAVCAATRFAADEQLNMHDYNDAYKVIRAITEHEQGSFDQYFTKAQLDVGCIKAGLENAPRGVGPTVIKGVAGVTGAASAAAASNPDAVLATYNAVKPIIDAGPHAIQAGFWIVVGLAFFGIALGEIIRIRNRKG